MSSLETSAPQTGGVPGVESGNPDDAVVTVTDTARARLLDLRAAEPEAERLGLRLAVTGTRDGEYAYDLSWEVVTQAELSDVVRNHGGLRVIVPAADVGRLKGAVLDLPDDDGLVLRNPNRPDASIYDGATLTGPLAERVQEVLDGEVNPALASHGGFVELAGVTGGTVLLRMGGGCQGCAMSRMTMIQGVEVMLRDAIAEVDEVVDVTDHTAGENPYY